MFADKVSRRAEGLVKSFWARLGEGEAEELQNGQSITEMILKLAKNEMLVEAVSSQHSEEEHFTKLKYVMDQKVEFQRRNMELSKQIETLSQPDLSTIKLIKLS
ncbi:hypothetical protein AA0111_g2067 [Alternaria arborescens]|uniref:hypothetical protein n=1 Tax=Alternaria arborescens TaxID=156630 RepID=UPI00107580C8|nr:hypothetical protein AA0111_g2067 [Alternaria arborescens]RYO39265.1 hypothetical protein AA0111_g2067 [Alternaria arborescens]